MWHRTVNDIKALKWVTLQLRNKAGIPQIWSNLGKPFMNFSIIYGLIREATLRLWLFEKSLSLAHHVLLPSITQMTSTTFFLTKKERKGNWRNIPKLNLALEAWVLVKCCSTPSAPATVGSHPGSPDLTTRMFMISQLLWALCAATT